MNSEEVLRTVREYEGLAQEWRQLQRRPDLNRAASIGVRFPDVLKELAGAAEGWGIESTALHDLWSWGLADADENQWYEAYLVIERIKARAASESIAPAKDLLTMREVAELVRLEKTSIRPYRKCWPRPDVPSRGKSPARWSYCRLLPVLKRQFPDETFPDRLTGMA